MTFLINAFKVIFLLGFLIFIHEGGHFLAAKLFKVKVEEFSIGFGPKIFSKKRKETEYSISLIPFGGYVKMTGEAEKSDEQGSFSRAKIWHRIIIVAAGAFVNIIFAIVVFFFLSVFSGNNISTTVSGILPEAAENISQIEIGDKILKINNKKVRLKSDIADSLKKSDGSQVALSSSTISERFYYAFWETINFIESMFEGLAMLFTGNVKLEQMTGPIGISEIVVKSSGIYNFIYLLSLISLSLGVTNLLPIPALDGGRLALLIIEGIRGKALKEEIELGIQSAGFFLLILLSLYVSYKDILRIF